MIGRGIYANVALTVQHLQNSKILDTCHLPLLAMRLITPDLLKLIFEQRSRLHYSLAVSYPYDARRKLS